MCSGHGCAFGMPYRGDVTRFGETLLLCMPHPHHRYCAKNHTLHHCQNKWCRAMWYGKSEETNEPLLLTEIGLGRARAVTGAHEVHGRPRKQQDLPIEATTVPPVGEESPVVDPNQSVPQHYNPPSSSGHTQQAMRKIRPHLAKRCHPFLLHRRATMVLIRCSTRRLRWLCVSTIGTLPTPMNHLTTRGKLLTALWRLRTSWRSSFLWTRRKPTSPKRKKRWTNVCGTKLWVMCLQAGVREVRGSTAGPLEPDTARGIAAAHGRHPQIWRSVQHSRLSLRVSVMKSTSRVVTSMKLAYPVIS